MGTYKSKSVLINFMVKIWLLEDRKIELINKKVMPLYFYLASIGDSIQAKKSLEDGSKFILVDGVPYSAIEVVNEVKRRIARGIVDTMFNKGVIYMEELILEIEEALYAYFIEETKKIRGEKKHMSDVEGYAIKCIRTKDDEFISQQTFIEYLEEIKKLDISSFKNKKVLFLTGYDGGLELFSPKNFDGVTMLCSEGETLVNQVLRDFERRPEAYKDIIERLDDSNKKN